MTDYREARVGLGADLRALRTGAGLTLRDLAERIGRSYSTLSRIETGRQTPTTGDLTAITAATGQEKQAGEFIARLRALDTHYVAWRRQLATGAAARARAAIDGDAAEQIRLLRQSTLDRAYATHPQRFTRRPQPPQLPETAWINQPQPTS